jgi:hypothetical protein
MRTFLKSMIAAAAITFAAGAAQATVTEVIVSFTAAQQGQNLTYADNGAAGWTLSTMTPKQVLVTLTDFSGGFIAGQAATFSFTGTGTGFAENVAGPLWAQAFDTGTLSFTAVNAISFNGNNIAAGGNILTLSFNGGEMSGLVPGASGGVAVSVPGDGFFNVSSDFIDFPPVRMTDFALTLGNIVPGLQFPEDGLGGFNGGRFANFTARGSGDLTAAVPEPGTWSMMLAGFGLVGLARRRSNRPATVAA